MEQTQHTILIYRHFFGTDQLPPKNLDKIKGINRDNVFRFLISVKVAVMKTYGKNIEHPFVQLLLRDLPKPYSQRLATMLSQDNQAYFLSHPVVINQIMSDLLNEQPSPEDPGKNNVRYFAGALLELLMIYNDHHYRTLQVGKRADSHDLVWEMMQMQNINGNNPASFVRSGIVKQVIFIEFLKYYLGDQYETFDKQMAALIGVKALGNAPLLYIQLQAVQDNVGLTDQPLVIISEADEIYPVCEQLRLVIDTTKPEGKYDPGRIIMHPFLKLSDGRLYLTGTHDFSMITDKGWEYFLFSAGRIGDYIPEIKNVNALRSFIGLNYIEKFLLAKIFKSLNRPGFRVILSDDLYTPDITIILNETDIFICEVKSASLNYRVWQEQDLTGFKQYLDEQYIKGKKGIIQLHKSLKHLSEKPQELFHLRTSVKKLKVYPVIIFTEPHLTISGVNDYMIEQAPVLDEKLSSQFARIAPLTLIHHDFFIENLKVLRENRSVIKKAINDYHQAMKTRKTHHTQINSTFNYIKAMQSFDNYIAGRDGLYGVHQTVITKELSEIFNPTKND